MKDSFSRSKVNFALGVRDEFICLVRRLGSTCLDQEHNEYEDEELLRLFYRWNHEGLYKYYNDYEDYDLGGLIEVARRGLQADLGFMAMKLMAGV
jgi:hypothetical protein